MSGVTLPWRWIILIYALLLGGCSAQIQVTVTFDPPSPVSMGNVTMRCEFPLSAGSTLVQQYWQVVSGDRIFTYGPGADPEIDPDYVDKILYFKSDDKTYQTIVFDVTPCDVEQYLCHVLANPGSEEGQAQKSLEVTNVISATLEINQTVPVESKVIAKGNIIISCELSDAGPPLPGKLALEMNGTEVKSSTDHAQDSETCMWNYATPLEYTVSEDITEAQVLRCRVDYTDTPSVNSQEITVVPDPCNGNPCQNEGNCSSEIKNNQAVFECECPCHTSGDRCETTVCDTHRCGANGTCSFVNCEAFCTCPEDVYGDNCVNVNCLGNECSDNATCWPFGGNDEYEYMCNCTVENVYGFLCDQTGCDVGVCSCENGGTCVDEPDTCLCQCLDGCSGDNCTIFDDGDLCSTCQNAWDCTQTCSYFECICDARWSGIYCNESCSLEVSDTTSEPGVFHLNITETMALRCDAKNATADVSWAIYPDNSVGSGENFTFNATEAGTSNLFCRIKTSSCVETFNYTFVVAEPIIELAEDGNEVCYGGECEPVTIGSETLRTIEVGMELNLKASIKLTSPLPTLLFVKEDAPDFDMTSDTARSRTILNVSDTGSVGFYDDYLNDSDAGNYIAVAQLLEYEKDLYTLVLGPVPPPSDDADGFPWWGILLIVIAVSCSCGCVILVVVFRDKIRKRKSTPPPAERPVYANDAPNPRKSTPPPAERPVYANGAPNPTQSSEPSDHHFTGSSDSEYGRKVIL